MFTLKNTQMSVSVLDPVSDRERLSSRYCHGGYIWQVDDHLKGPLFSGPMYPSENPDPFDGQGIPEVFETSPGYYPTTIGDQVMVIGVGLVTRTSPVEPYHSRDNTSISRYCQWTIEKNDTAQVSMKTIDSFTGYGYALIRKVSIENSVLISETELLNTGSLPLPMRWFAHPFFPVNNSGICANIESLKTIPENPGFYFHADNQVAMHKTHDWKKMCYRPLEIDWKNPLTLSVSHPLLDTIVIKTDFPVSWLPIWANPVTFSIEPFLMKLLKPEESSCWKMTYMF
jgi:hypothetical protein